MSNNMNLVGRRILLVDDSSTIRRCVEIFLGEAGCEVMLADDGFDALAKLSEFDPDLIFVDVLMPRLNGYQTCALIKGSDKHKDTPVIMLSGKDNAFDRARGRTVGANTYLTKPFSKENLLRAVEANPSNHGHA